MRHLKIIAVGKIKQSAKYLATGIALYQKHLEHYGFRIEWVEIAESSPTATRPLEQTLEQEANAILRHCSDASTNFILLDERGKLLDSKAFAECLFQSTFGNPLDGGRPQMASTPMIIVIGGAYGTSQKLKAKASLLLSLSPLTFPHQLVRLVLMEQLYRAITICNNEPYHK